MCCSVCVCVHSSYADLSKFVKLWNKQTRILMKTGKQRRRRQAETEKEAEAGKGNETKPKRHKKPLTRNTKQFPAKFAQRTWQNHKVQKAKLLPGEFNVLPNKNTSSQGRQPGQGWARTQVLSFCVSLGSRWSAADGEDMSWGFAKCLKVRNEMSHIKVALPWRRQCTEKADRWLRMWNRQGQRRGREG